MVPWAAVAQLKIPAEDVVDYRLVQLVDGNLERCLEDEELPIRLGKMFKRKGKYPHSLVGKQDEVKPSL